MGLIKEPADMDFYVDPRTLTREEQKKVRDFIKFDKKNKKHGKPKIKNSYV
jgi:hypothetical protein